MLPPRLLGAYPVSLTAAFVIAVPRQVNKVLNMLSCWFAHREENVKGNYTEEFRRHAVRMMDYLWAAEDGVKMQGYNGSQLWDTAFAAQALLSAGARHSLFVLLLYPQWFPPCLRRVLPQTAPCAPR